MTLACLAVMGALRTLRPVGVAPPVIAGNSEGAVVIAPVVPVAAAVSVVVTTPAALAFADVPPTLRAHPDDARTTPIPQTASSVAGKSLLNDEAVMSRSCKGPLSSAYGVS